jgi:hypothetical protein
MQKISISDLQQYVEENIGSFHQKRIQSLDNLKLVNVLKRKNPYLFKAKNVLTADHIVRGIVDAHISSNEETIFGEWLEGLAIFVNKKVYDGYKSGITGIDLEFTSENIRYIVSIKSGPNWGNSSQINKMKSDFTSAKKSLRTSNSNLTVVAVNGCCYGTDNKPDKGEYFKYCGQKFWEFISGDSCMFKNLIEPIGTNAKQRNDEFLRLYSEKINLFIFEFTSNYCLQTGQIDWSKLLELNSGQNISKE